MWQEKERDVCEPSSIDNASHVRGRNLTGLADVLIWFTISVLPFLLPFVLIGWFVYVRTRRRPAPHRPDVPGDGQ